MTGGKAHLRRMDPQHDFTPSCSSVTQCISAGARCVGFGHGEYIDVRARCGGTEQLRKRVLQGFADREHIDVSVRVQLGRVDRGDGEAKVVRLARHDFRGVLHLLGSTALRCFCLPCVITLSLAERVPNHAKLFSQRILHRSHAFESMPAGGSAR